MAKKIDELKKRYPSIVEDIIELQGKPFVTYEGLLNEAHRQGLISIETEIIQFPNLDNNNTCIFKDIATGKDKVFTGYGDANPNNVNRNISKHLIRMSETRAKARALRDFTNIGITASDEIDIDDLKDNNKNSNGTPANNKQNTQKKNNSSQQGNKNQQNNNVKLINNSQKAQLQNLLTQNPVIFKQIATKHGVNDVNTLTEKDAQTMINEITGLLI